VVGQLDRLVDHFHHAGLATLVYGTLDLHPDGAATLVVTNAGHPPPLLVGPGGARYLDGVTSPLIGAVDLPERVEQTWRLPPGWTLVLYTDGLVERAALPLDEGLDRLARVAATTAGCPAVEVCARITEACGASDDDIALLVVRAPSR
jgi:serine phosphatase RsbU (regulator of sigma subunit)